MINKIILTLVLLLQTDSCYTIRLEDYYRSEGVVFNQSVDLPFSLPRFRERYTPHKEEIVSAEIIFRDSLNLVRRKDDRFSDNLENIDVTKHYSLWNRRYAGYINSDGQRIIVMNLMNFEHEKKAVEYFKDWDKDFILGYDGFYTENQTPIYLINIDTGEMFIK